MNKFENVDIFASLDAIMRQNTGFFQSDFDIDKEIIAKAAASPNREDKTLLWFCRPSGTHCFKERERIPPPTIHGVFTKSRPATAFLPMPSS